MPSIFWKTCFCCSHLSHTGSEYHPYWYPPTEYTKQDFHSPNVESPHSYTWLSASVHLYNSLGNRIHINVNVLHVSQLHLNFFFYPHISSSFCLKGDILHCTFDLFLSIIFSYLLLLPPLVKHVHVSSTYEVHNILWLLHLTLFPDKVS